jgi:uncharacterized protein (DUF697 family)
LELPLSLVIIGDESQFDSLLTRLNTKLSALRIDSGAQMPDVDGQVVFDASRLLSISDPEFIEALGKIAIRHADRRILLAARVHSFRSPVTNQLSHEWAFKNAKTAAISALPGGIPLTDWLMPATSVGDLYILTKNQIILLLEIAACYGRPPRLRATLKELLPVVGGAFGWRAIARELIGLVPGGIGVAVKAAVAYAGTYSVGRAAAYYYAGDGKVMSKRRLETVYRRSLMDGFERARDFFSRK